MASALSQPGSASLPLVPVACATTAGAAMAHAPSGAAVTALALPCILALLVLTPRMRTALLAVLLGLLLGRLTSAPVARPPELVGARLPAVYRLEGRILQIDPTASRTQAFTLDVDRLGAQRRALARASRVDVRLRLRGPAPWRDGDLMPGARIDVLARVYERRGRLRAYVHDRRAVHVVEPAGQTERAVAELRRRAAWSFSRRFDRRDDGLARALLLGDRGRLDHGDRSLFRLTGQAHLLAVSGLHVGLLLGGLLLLLRVVGASPRLLWSTGIVAAAFYVPFTGAQPSVVRAGLGAATWFLARLAGRRPRGAAVLTTVAVLVVVGRPAAVGEPAFQLSFAAVASIFLLGGPLRRRLVPERPVIPGLLPPRRAPLRSALAISTAAWLGTAPFVATYIGRLCPAGPALSLVALPLTAVLLASGCLVLLAAPLPPLASLAGGVFELAAEALRAALEAASAVRLHAWDVARPTGLWWVLYGVAVLAAARSSPGASRAPWLALPVLLGLLFVPGGLPLLSRAREDGPQEYDAAGVQLLSSPPAVVLPEALPVLCVGAGLLVFALVSVRLGWLGARGAAAAWGLGVAAFLAFRAAGIAALVAPFLVATLLGKLPGAERSAARDLRQVLCNGLPAFLGCLFALSDRPDLGLPFFLGSLACLGSDSCATEVGVRFGGPPMRLLGGGPVAIGESGGVTKLGTLAAVLGAALAPAGFLLFSELGLRGLLLMTAAGLAGSLLDSALGGWLQFRGRAPGSERQTEAPWIDGAPTEHVSGWRWLDNDAVNLVTGLAAGAIAVALAYLA